MSKKGKLITDIAMATNIVNASPILGVVENKLSKLPRSFDARDWASEFVEIFAKLYPGVKIDEGWMLCWFANSLMAGYDEATSRYRKRMGRMEKKVEALKAENKGLRFYAAKKAKSEGVK